MNRLVIILFLLIGLAPATSSAVLVSGAKEYLESDNYIFRTQVGSTAVYITSKNTDDIVKVYYTIEPIVSLTWASDLLFRLRQLRRNRDHVIEVWVNVGTLQVVRAAHETESREATQKALRIIKKSFDPILNRQNKRNLSKKQYCGCPQILMGVGDRLCVSRSE